MDKPEELGRRGFLGTVAGAVGAAITTRAEAKPKLPRDRPVVISTWPFGVPANNAAWAAMPKGSLLDACIAGVTVVERDPTVNSVGKGGLPNAAGVVQLDACVMDGRSGECGAVASLEDIATAAMVAKAVMEKTRHVLLVGPGAQQFALKHGFKKEQLLTPEARARWQRWQRESKNTAPAGHDTIGLLGVNRRGDVAGVCTTSGLAWKMPGRVGDSPLIGHGLFVDQDVGAAAATGVGEEVIRICGSHTVVEQMRAGKTPQQACEEACRRIIHINLKRRGRKEVPPDAFIAVNKRGQVGAASVHAGYFKYALTRRGRTWLLEAKGLLPKRTK